MTILMTEAEIHDFGIEVVVKYLRKDGHEIVASNSDLAKDPQVVTMLNGQLSFIVVRTACYPGKGTVDVATKQRVFAKARQHGAICYFASVGIANADGRNDAEMATPVKGAGYHVAYAGLEAMYATDQQ